jgi:hypothetical protein
LPDLDLEFSPVVFIGFLINKVAAAVLEKELLRLLLLFEDADLGAYLDCRLDGESLLIIGYCNYSLLDSQLSILFM